MKVSIKVKALKPIKMANENNSINSCMLYLELFNLNLNSFGYLILLKLPTNTSLSTRK